MRPSRAGAETAAANGAWHGEALIGARLILIKVISYACCASARAALRLDLPSGVERHRRGKFILFETKEFSTPDVIIGG